MPVYAKDQEVVGYQIGEKVWCEYCWEKEKPEGTPTHVRKKDLRKNTYVCDSCKGRLPVDIFTKWLEEHREEIKEYIRRNIEEHSSKKEES